MERQYTRIDEVRKVLDPIIKNIKDDERKRCAFVHLYGVGQFAALLAIKRGYSREVAELAEIAGMLHDITKYVENDEDDDHAHTGADYAKDNILGILDCFTKEEIDMIYNGIYNHSDKYIKGFWFDEIIKDADSAQHALRNPNEDYFYNKKRFQDILKEII